MNTLERFFGLKDANDRILGLAKTLALFLPLVSATVTLSTTFYTIFVAEAVGNGSYIEGLSIVGILVAIQLGAQTALDYPTGAIGDWIGQKYIISSAFICFAASFYLTSFVSSLSPFFLLVIVFLLQGIGNSQLSGSFQAWFDNNYVEAMPGDPERKQFGVLWGRVGMLFQIVSTASLIPGSVLAAVLGRAWVFQLQGVLCAVIAVVVMFAINDFPEVKAVRSDKPSFEEYTTVLKDGVRYLFSDKWILYVIVGGTIVMSTSMVWGQLILFPMYFSYLLTDVAVSSFRTMLFFAGIASQERSGVWSKRFDPETWIPRFRVLQSVGFVFYMVFAAIMQFLPPDPSGSMVTLAVPFTELVVLQLPSSSILPVILMAITFTVTGFFGGFAQILTQREMVDVVPNKIRNSLYSLSPTISTLFAIPQIIFFGWLIGVAGFTITLALCGIISLSGAVVIRYGLKHPKPELINGCKRQQETASAVARD
jgi:MFS family permease